MTNNYQISEKTIRESKKALIYIQAHLEGSPEITEAINELNSKLFRS